MNEELIDVQISRKPVFGQRSNADAQDDERSQKGQSELYETDVAPRACRSCAADEQQRQGCVWRHVRQAGQERREKTDSARPAKQPNAP